MLLTLWNMEGKETTTLAGHESAIKCIDRDSAVIVSSSDDTTVKVWYLPCLCFTLRIKGYSKCSMCFYI